MKKEKMDISHVVLLTIMVAAMLALFGICLISSLEKTLPAPLKVEFNSHGNVSRLSVSPLTAMDAAPTELSSPDDATFEILAQKAGGSYNSSESINYDNSMGFTSYYEDITVQQPDAEGFPDLSVSKDEYGALVSLFGTNTFKDTLIPYILKNSDPKTSTTMDEDDTIVHYTENLFDASTNVSPEQATLAMEGKINRFGEWDLLVTPLTFCPTANDLIAENDWLSKNANAFGYTMSHQQQTTISQSSLYVSVQQTITSTDPGYPDGHTSLDEYSRSCLLMADSSSDNKTFEAQHTESYIASGDSETDLLAFVNSVLSQYALSEAIHSRSENRESWEYAVSKYNPFKSTAASLQTASVLKSYDPSNERYAAEIQISYTLGMT